MRILCFILTISLFYACQCDECKVTLPYVQFYQKASDSILHPLNENDSLRVFVYYKNGTWDQPHLLDSNQIIRPNWFNTELNNASPNEENSFVLDHGITLTDKINDLGNYDYLLKSTGSNLEIKLSKMKIETTGNEGRCPCENSQFSACTINDSLTDYSHPIGLW